MSDTIIVAILSLLGTSVGSIVGILQSNKLVNYRIDKLETQVSKHNNLIDRMYSVESRVTLLEDEMRNRHE